MKSIFEDLLLNWRRLTSIQRILVVVAVALTTLYGGAKSDVTPVQPDDPQPVTPVQPDDPQPVEPEEPDEPEETDLGLPDLTLAQTYNGYLCDAEEELVVGTIQVKAAKATKNRKTGETTSKLTIAIQIAGEKKVSAKGEVVVTNCLVEATAGGKALSLQLGANRCVGTFGDYAITGVRDVFASKAAADKETANAALAKWKGSYSIFSDEGVFTVSVAAKGKVKFSGVLANGKKTSASTQLLVDDDVCTIPVVVSKTGVNVAFVMLLDNESEEIDLVGLDGVRAWGVPSALSGEASFVFDSDELCDILGDGTYAAYFPDGVSVVQSGTKWIVANGAKAGKVVLNRSGEVDETKAGENPSGLKLTYKAKDGSFSGSFKAYVENRGKPTAVTVSVSGVVIDGMGYGTLAVKNKGSAFVQIGIDLL